MSRIRYIGSKARIASRILDIIEEKTSSKSKTFFDLFAGTGSVSREAISRGWKVKANDSLYAASILTTSQLLSAKDVAFDDFGGYLKAIDGLNNAQEIEGYIYKEYTPSGRSKSGDLRLYFTEQNGKKIDGVRAKIKEWYLQHKLTKNEFMLLTADLIEAVNSVANIAGTYGCFLSHWTQPALQEIVLKSRKLHKKRSHFRVYNEDVFALKAGLEDVVYMDPPYTKRQYAAYYHILETLAVGDEPDINGVTGLRPWEEKSSVFCYKKKALYALCSLIRNLGSNHIFISYSSEGHIDICDLKEELTRFGQVYIYEIGDIGRYRPNQVATSKSACVTEYLIEINLKTGQLSLDFGANVVFKLVRSKQETPTKVHYEQS